MRRLALVSDENLRRRINRVRKEIASKRTSAGIGTLEGIKLIENLPWQGYRLAPDRVAARLLAKAD